MKKRKFKLHQGTGIDNIDKHVEHLEKKGWVLHSILAQAVPVNGPGGIVSANGQANIVMAYYPLMYMEPKNVPGD